MHHTLWERNFDARLVECIFAFFIDVKIDRPN